MSLLFAVARAFHGLIPDGPFRRRLTAAAYRALYAGKIADCRCQNGVFILKTRDGVTVKSLKEFDPAPLAGEFRDLPVNRGDTAADLGGNLGVAAVYLSKKVGTKGRVIVFEPDPDNFAILTRNLALNGCRNVTAVQKGVWDRNTTLKFFCGGNYTSSFRTTDYVEKDKKQYCVRKVPVTTLDAEMKRLKIRKLAAVKMDIEGSEVQALQGAIRTLKALRPALLVETHRVGATSTQTGVIRALRKAGYEKITVSGPRRTPTITARFV